MERRHWVTATLIVALAGPVGAVHDAQQLTDRNGDGRIDRSEFRGRMRDVFFLMDVDRDGRLTAGEAREHGIDRPGLAAADRSGDGALQLEEFVDARMAAFRNADADGNGALSEDEIEAFDS